jgi:hypothetical protein
MRERASHSRRVFLTRAAGVVLTLGATPLRGGRAGPRAVTPYTGGVWLLGDHHIHTQYSIDGCYEIGEQVAGAAQSGLDFCVITDHGGPGHDKVALHKAYPELVAARQQHPELIIFQGLEWNIPAAEHGSIILPPTDDEARLVAEFEARFDARHLGHLPAEADAVAGVTYLQSLRERPLFLANHPARRGIDSPHELRAWADAGPDVMRGFEGAPGHGAATLVGVPRGHYNENPSPDSFPGYPPESYRTFGGYDYYVARVGGLWDSLLGEGRPFYITATSDSHRRYGDLRRFDIPAYRRSGQVQPTGELLAPESEKIRPDTDYAPGLYGQTRVYAARRDPLAVLAAMRSGNMYTVLGGLIDRLELWAHDGAQAVPMGSTLLLGRRGATVEVVCTIEVAGGKNLGGCLPVLDHVDLIAGQIRGPAANRDDQSNPTARVVARLRPRDGEQRESRVTFRHRFADVRGSFYVRLRGTNTDVVAPQMDPPGIDPWADLWFYSNPILVRVP